MHRIIFIILSTFITGFLVRPDAAVPLSFHAYPEQLPGTYTGGFGEESCHSCHFDYPLNPGEGSLHIEGIPSSYEPGQVYTFTISINRKDLGRAGFQLSARFPDSTQAGTFTFETERLAFTKTDKSIQYVQHSAKGTEPNDPTSNIWILKWAAPEKPQGTVIFNLAANAANGDASEFGDYIFLKEVKSKPTSAKQM